MSEKIKDLVIIGAGPSGLSAAIYASREGIDTTIYEKAGTGGLVATISQVDNYPGFPEGINGIALSEKLEAQAKKFGTKIEYGEVTALSDCGDYRTLVVDDQKIKAKVVLIATGRCHRKLNIPGEKEWIGRGIHYCATCDGAFYKNKKVVVVGGGNSAVQESIFLTRFAKHIDLLVRGEITATNILQKSLQKLVDEKKTKVYLNTDIKEIIDDTKHITAVKITTNGKATQLDTDGIFVLIGLVPNTAFIDPKQIKLSDYGNIMVDQNNQTSMTNVFACGDVRDGAISQITPASADGIKAVLSMRHCFK